MNAMTGFTQRMTVAAVEADIIDVSTGFDSLDSALGMTTVTMIGGPYQLTARHWRGDAPRVGDAFTLTVEAVQ